MDAILPMQQNIYIMQRFSSVYYVIVHKRNNKIACLFDRGGECQHNISYRPRRAAAAVRAEGATHGNMSRVPGDDRHLWEARAARRQMFRL